MKNSQPIFNSFAPNAQRDDLKLIGKLLLPWNWSKLVKPGTAHQELKKRLGLFFDSQAYLFDSGRTSLKELLTAYEFAPDSKIIIQAFTCSVVPHAIIQAGYRPIYCDIDPQTYNYDIKKLELKLAQNKAKALIVQHTFGIPAPMTEIQDLCHKYGITLIEDLAHSLGGKYQSKKLGTFGESAILSFGSDKMISSTRGGAIITTNQKIQKKLEEIRIPLPSIAQTLQRLLQPIWFSTFRPLYNKFNIGKTILYFCKRFGLTPKTIQPCEKKLTCSVPTYQYSESLAALALNQWQKLNEFNQHRTVLVSHYNSTLEQNLPKLPLLRYPLLVENRSKLLAKLKEQNIHLDVWYPQVVGPAYVDQTAAEYLGDCPEAEQVAQKIINLPTHVGVNSKLIQKLNQLISNKN